MGWWNDFTSSVSRFAGKVKQGLSDGANWLRETAGKAKHTLAKGKDLLAKAKQLPVVGELVDDVILSNPYLLRAEAMLNKSPEVLGRLEKAGKLTSEIIGGRDTGSMQILDNFTSKKDELRKALQPLLPANVTQQDFNKQLRPVILPFRRSIN